MILPVVVTPCNFRRTRLSQFQAVNDPTRPLSLMPQEERDVVWDKLVEVVLDMLAPPPAPAGSAAPPAPVAPATVPGNAPKGAAAPPAPFASATLPTHSQPASRLQPGTLLLTCQGHADPVLGVAWAPDGARLASASVDQTVRVWDAASGRLLLTCQGHEYSLNGVAWAPDGPRLASAGRDQTVRVWWVG